MSLMRRLLYWAHILIIITLPRSALLTALARQKTQGETIMEMREELVRQRKATLDKGRRKILNSFGTIDPEQYQQNFIKLRQPGTGIWLTDGSEFKQWMTSKNGKLWLYGIGRLNIVQSMIINLIHCEAGAGKTILMYAVSPSGHIEYWV